MVPVAGKLVVGQQSGQSSLYRVRSSRNAGQQQRAFGRGFDGARLIVVAEDRCGKGVGILRSAVDDDEAAGTATALVYVAGERFTTAAGFSRDEDTGIGRCCSIGTRDGCHHFRIVGEDAGGACCLVEGGAQRRILPLQRGLLRCLADDLADVRQPEGLFDIVEGAVRHCLDGRGRVGVGRDHHDFGSRPVLFRLTQQFEAIDAGHAQVGQNQLILFFRKQCERGCAVLGAVDVVPFPA